MLRVDGAGRVPGQSKVEGWPTQPFTMSSNQSIEVYSPREIAQAAGVSEEQVLAVLGGVDRPVPHADAVRIGALAVHMNDPKDTNIVAAAPAPALFSVFSSRSRRTPSKGVPLAVSSTLHAGMVAAAVFFALVSPSTQVLAWVFGELDNLFGLVSLHPQLANFYFDHKFYISNVIGAALLLQTVIMNPGGLGQVISPLTRWFAGRPFTLHDPDGDAGVGAMEGSSVRA